MLFLSDTICLLENVFISVSCSLSRHEDGLLLPPFSHAPLYIIFGTASSRVIACHFHFLLLGLMTSSVKEVSVTMIGTIRCLIDRTLWK